MIADTFPEEPEAMLAIAYCESGMRQFDNDGNVVESHTSDRGIFQINEIWDDTAEELGYDLDTTLDNILMARYVYDIQGVEAWVCYDKVV